MPPFLLLAALAGTTVLKGYFQASAEEEQQKALDFQLQEQHLQYQQKRLQNYDLAERVLSTQKAQAAARGVSLGSSSFNAIQRNAFNSSAREAGNLDTEEDILTKYNKSEKSNVRNTLYAQLFGDAASAIKDAYSVSNSAPTKA